MKTAVDLLREKLVEIGADGLCETFYSCGCRVDDLAPHCSGIHFDCVPAKNDPKKAIEMECNFWMEPMEDES